MEYHQTEYGLIQADYARRLGLALRQYRQVCSQQHEDYSVTLSLSVLQSLLCSCMHLAEKLASNNRIKCFLSVPMGPSLPASHELIVFRKALPRKPHKFIDFLKILRDAMSHPNPINCTSENAPTGFTSIPDDSGVIKFIRFVWAPYVDNGGRLRGFRTKEEAQEWAHSYVDGESSRQDCIKIVQMGQFWYVRDTMKNAFVSKGVIVELSCDQIWSLAIALSTLLAQPLNENWDHQTIVPLEDVA
jgi:hypothetical protein